MRLRRKLLLLYAVILAAVIAVMSWFLVDQTKKALMEGVHLEVKAHAEAVAAVLEFEDGAWRIDPESGIEKTFEQGSGLYYLVYDVLKPRPPVLASRFARAVGAHERFMEQLGTWSQSEVHAGGHDLHEVGVRVEKTEDDAPGAESRSMRALVVCGKDLFMTNMVVKELVQRLLFFGPLVLLGSLLGGWFLVSRALKPIDRIAKTAAEIKASDLSRRIPVKGKDELARLATTLNATFDRLQQGFERERRFTADASHELRTPLAAVTGNVEVALNQERSPEEYRQILADIGEAGARMQSLLEGLLALARTDAETKPAATEEVALGPLCEEVVRLHRPMADRAGVSIDLATDPGIAVRGNAEHLRTLISNLVSNAIRYNRAGGRVAVAVARADGQARISVDDTGIGISEQDLPHVFERFYRADPSRSAKSGGIGLGLAIAKAIVDGHGGTIGVTSLPDRGTRFQVLLPA